MGCKLSQIEDGEWTLDCLTVERFLQKVDFKAVRVIKYRDLCPACLGLVKEEKIRRNRIAENEILKAYERRKNDE